MGHFLSLHTIVIAKSEPTLLGNDIIDEVRKAVIPFHKICDSHYSSENQPAGST